MPSRPFALLRSAFFAALFVALWTWFIPRWLAGGDLHPRWSVPGLILMAVGALIMLKCVWDFGWEGRGTPAPFDPPRRLVVVGLYRFVRNPMYVGMGCFLFGEAIVLPQIMDRMLLVIVIAWTLVNGFIILYEEPTLERLFGEDYEEYKKNVKRWWPRVRPFDKSQTPTVTSLHLD